MNEERPQVGDTYIHERTFTPEDVRTFGEISGDRQSIHTDPDEEGRLIVQGLLTATVPTKIGGDLAFLAREMTFDFRRPVYTGETISCTWETEAVIERDDRFEASGTAVLENEAGETVLVGQFDGVIWK
jgi:acyl dehydratase